MVEYYMKLAKNVGKIQFICVLLVFYFLSCFSILFSVYVAFIQSYAAII